MEKRLNDNSAYKKTDNDGGDEKDKFRELRTKKTLLPMVMDGASVSNTASFKQTKNKHVGNSWILINV